MVNTLQKIYNKTPWQQRRLSQPLSDPNYMPSTLQHSTVYEEEIHDHDNHQPADADTSEDPADQTQLRRQVSIAEPALTRSSTNRHIHDKSNSSSGGNEAGSDSNQQPLRRGMTRADTKISLRKSNKDSRRVFINIPPPAQYLDKSGAPKLSYGSNRINTAKYTTLTFLPKNLFEQFRRVANMFFLFMAIIQLTPIFTVGSPFLTVFPLCFVVGVTAIKDGFEDYKRHVEDRNFNQRLCLQLKNVVNYNYPTAGLRAARKDMGIFARVWNSLTHGLSTGTKKSMRALRLAKKPSRDLPQLDLNDLAPMDDDDPRQQQDGAGADGAKTGPQPEFIKEQWHNLRVGDFIMLKNNQAVPADAIILSTSETEGSCFIETKDLDGETNLKTRESLHETSKYNTARRCSRLKCFVDMEPINANLFSFNGSLTMLARKRHANPNAGPSASNRYSHYAPSVTSSMMSSPRASMDENDWTRESSAGQHQGEGTADSQQPAQSGTSASDYARLHKSASHRRRSRFSESLDASSSHAADMSGTNTNGGDKEEYQESEDMSYQEDPSSLRATKSKRSSLHRSATGVSMAGASEMAKNVLKANHEQQMHQQQQSHNGAIRRGLSVSTSNVNSPYKETTIPVDINNMLLRGHVIRNTHWVIAVIVATGTETKIMLNSGETPSKRSRIEKTMNIQVALNFGILLLLCVVCAVGSTIYDRKWRGTAAEQLWDMSTRGVVLEGVITFFTSLIIFQNIIPISLYISIEFVKTFQAYFIWQDTDMYDVELDQFCTPKTWNLTDDLGQIEYVFSDKTGTLTRNIMEFKKCSINGKIYGNNAVSGQTDAELGLQMMNEGGEGGAQHTDDQNQHGDKKAVLEEFDREVRRIFEPTYMDALEILTFADPELLQDLTGTSSSESKSTTSAGEGSSNQQRDAGSSGQLGAPTHDGSPASNIRDFFTLLALCHTVVVEQPEEAVEDDEDDDFGIYEDNGSPTSKQSGDDSSETSPEQKTSRFGLRDKLKRKAEAAGLSVPGATSNVSGNRSRKNSSATDAPSGIKSAAGANGSGGSLDEHGKPKPTICYRAESPDEAALVSAAKNVGFAFVSRGVAAGSEGAGGGKAGGNSRQNVNLNVLGQDFTYEQLDVIKFNSTRKRMTVIVREPQELGGRILLLTKGADNVIFERLSHETKDDALRDQTEQDIEAFSNMGLRTLTLAQRVLDQQTYDTWAEKYAAAGKALDDRAKKMDQVAEEIEKDLTLLGATAIEDKLQEGVPDSIAAMRQAGIKVWVLTGDKLETAINIGFASKLLEKEMKLEIMKMGRNEKPEQVLKRFKQLVDGVLSGRGSEEEQDAAAFTTPSGDKEEVEDHQPQDQQAPHPAEPNAVGQGRPYHDKSLPPTPAGSKFEDPMSAALHVQHALIVDGSALKILLDDPDARKDLIKLSDVCFSVICCRASPLQKALVVELIRRGKKTVCLAIGDGANDVSMIQAANIGVGIAGQEGMQAAMASDYSITQFRFIRKLVIVHGHWGYMRIAEMILNFFFKNVLWVGAVLWFQIYCGFSAMLFYDYTFVSLYNLMFTAVPVLVLGATDQDLTAPYILRYPGVYRLGIHQKRYNQYRFVAYMLDGVWQSLVVFWFWRAVYGINVLGTNGIDSSLLEFSTSVAMTNIVIASLYLGLHTYHWTWLMHFAVWGSIVFMVLLVLIYGAFTASPIYHVAIRLFSLGPFWLMLILSVVCAFMVRYTVLFISFWWFPDDVHAARGIMIAEKRIAKALKVRWTGLAPDGMAPDEQTEQEKAILKKEDAKREAKEAAKAEKKAAKNGGKGQENSEEQPYDLTMIQINVNDHSPNASAQTQNLSDPNQSKRPPTPLEIQQQLLRAQQQQFQQMTTPDGHTLKPDDPSFQYSRRTSSYNYINTLQDKPAALPPVPSPSLPSLPTYSAKSSETSLHAPQPAICLDMTSTRPVRSSARQSAIRQQEQEVAEAKEAERRQKIALRMEQLARQKEQQEQQERERALSSSSLSSSSSSRSLSPALSDSGDSLSSGGSDDDDEDEESTVDANGSASQRRSKRSTCTPVAGVSSSWEIALVYGFLTKFRSLLRQTCPLHEYSIEDLEAGLEATSSNTCIEEIHANLLSNMLNRKKAVDAQTWQKVLSETLDAKQKTGELEYDVNPLRFYNDYYSIPSPDRIQLLRALVDWVLQEGTVIRQGIEQDNKHYAVEPFGTDQSRRVYWYFGEGTLRVYRETKSAKKKNNDWETVASTIEELKVLADSFNGTSYKAEKALRERIRAEIIEPMEEKILQNKLKQERLEKRMHRLAELHQIAATRTTRTRSSNRINAPKYTFDDEEDFEDEDEFAMYRRPSSRRRLVDNSENLSGTQTSGPHAQQTHGTDQEHDQDQLLERSESVEPSSSTRSSVGHDSDTSIRVALQRTRVGDAEEEEEAAALTRTGGWVSDHGWVERDRANDHYLVETDMNGNNNVASVTEEVSALDATSMTTTTTTTTTTPTTTIITPAPPVATDTSDVEMKPATV